MSLQEARLGEQKQGYDQNVLSHIFSEDLWNETRSMDFVRTFYLTVAEVRGRRLLSSRFVYLPQLRRQNSHHKFLAVDRLEAGSQKR